MDRYYKILHGFFEEEEMHLVTVEIHPDGVVGDVNISLEGEWFQ